MMYIPDNYDLWENYEEERERAMERLPVCSFCEEPIQQDTAVRIDGLWYCDHCLNNHFRESTEE